MKNLEELIKSEYDNMHTNNDLLMPSEDYRPKARPKPFKRFAMAACILTALLITTTVFANALGLFDLARLGQADNVTQVTLVSPYGEEAEAIITADGIKIGLVAVADGGEILDIYVMMLDTAENRLDGEVEIDFSIDIPVWNEENLRRGVVEWNLTPLKIIDRNIDTGVVTLHGRQYLNFSLENQEFGIVLHTLSYDIEQITDAPLLINLQEETQSEPEVLLAIFHSSMMVAVDGEYAGPPYLFLSIDGVYDGQDLQEIAWEQGLSVLKPHQSDSTLESSMPFELSSIGIIDGRLRVQIYAQDYPQASLMLRQNGEEIPAIGHISFQYNPTPGLDETGFLHHLDPANEPHFIEWAFDINQTNLSNYALYANFLKSSTLPIGYTISFPID